MRIQCISMHFFSCKFGEFDCTSRQIFASKLIIVLLPLAWPLNTSEITSFFSRTRYELDWYRTEFISFLFLIDTYCCFYHKWNGITMYLFKVHEAFWLALAFRTGVIFAFLRRAQASESRATGRASRRAWFAPRARLVLASAHLKKKNNTKNQ